MVEKREERSIQSRVQDKSADFPSLPSVLCEPISAQRVTLAGGGGLKRDLQCRNKRRRQNSDLETTPSLLVHSPPIQSIHSFTSNSFCVKTLHEPPSWVTGKILLQNFEKLEFDRESSVGTSLQFEKVVDPDSSRLLVAEDD